MTEGTAEHEPPPAFDLVVDDVVLILVAGADRAAVEDRAVKAGASTVVAELAEVGLGGLDAFAAEAGATVVVLPALIGRWLAGSASSGAAASSVRLAVLVAPRLDDRSAEGVRSWVPSAEIVAWAPAGRPSAPWEAAPALAAEPGSSRAGRVGLGAPEPGRDALECSVLDLFQTITGVVPVGRTDSMTGLEVDRGRAAWFADEARARFGVALRASELIDHPSVDAVIELIRAGQGHDRRAPVTAVLPSAGAAGPPLLLLHGVDGSAHSLLPLAASLPVPVVGFESPLLDGRPSPFDQLELMAMRYLADVRRAQPEGPYRLAGRGFGGALAYEIARQLLEEGATVSELVVADCGPAARTSTETSSLAELGVRVRRALSRSTARTRERVPLLDRASHARAEHLRLLGEYRWPALDRTDLAVTVVWSSDLGSDDASLGWDGLVGRAPVTIERLPPADAADGPDGDEAGWADALRRAVER